VPERREPATVVIGCGALGLELAELVRLNGLAAHVRIRCLPSGLHMRPERIADAVDRAILRWRDDYERIFVAYGDCGTGGRLDRVLAAHGVERLPGAHCYEFFGGDTFRALAAAEPGTFYLTDYLARNFERLVIGGLGLDRHPELGPLMFANYVRVAYLSQRDDPEVLEAARAVAARLGLAFVHRRVGYGDLGRTMARLGVAEPEGDA
jgi:hypothetical protein